MALGIGQMTKQECCHIPQEENKPCYNSAILLPTLGWILEGAITYFKYRGGLHVP